MIKTLIKSTSMRSAARTRLIAIDGEPGYLAALSSRGILSVYKDTSQGFQQLWDVNVNSPRVKAPYGMGARINGRAIFVVRDARRSQAAWVLSMQKQGLRPGSMNYQMRRHLSSTSPFWSAAQTRFSCEWTIPKMASFQPTQIVLR